ncbi:hypothetical protein AWB74_00023 [Caballeronia arvi]|uniref:Uncharacterized protein n=1 Tax=Caballeronia arvi TaxID=1777135 RepID=A0A158EQ20_9BURK|nr:hypothetical protein AWB74_00023 [Caballeronia arvi]
MLVRYRYPSHLTGDKQGEFPFQSRGLPGSAQ